MTQITGSPFSSLHTHRLRSTTTLNLTDTNYQSAMRFDQNPAEAHIIRIATTGNIFFRGDDDNGTGSPPPNNAEYLLTEGVHFIRYDASTGHPYLYFRLHAAGTATVNIALMNPYLG